MAPSKPQFFDQEATFLGAAGDAHHPAALEPGDLPGNAAHRTGGAGDHHGLAVLRLADVEQREVGGHAGHAQRREIAWQRRAGRVDLVETLGLADEIVLHAEGAVDVVAGLEAGVLRNQHLADAERTHHLADPHRRDVGAGVVHPAAHRRVQRQVLVLHQDLALGRFAERGFDETEGVAAGQPAGTLGQLVLPIDLGGHGRALECRETGP